MVTSETTDLSIMHTKEPKISAHFLVYGNAYSQRRPESFPKGLMEPTLNESVRREKLKETKKTKKKVESLQPMLRTQDQQTSTLILLISYKQRNLKTQT